jgi:protein involved in polysaccharide export with SLBB domain
LQWTLPTALLAAAGCAAHQNELARELLTDRTPAAHRADVAQLYTVHCPDILALAIGPPSNWSNECPVGPDGRIALPDGKPFKVDGLTLPEIRRAIARQVGVGRSVVDVSVAAYRSQQLFLFGEVSGAQRAVAYLGPETVLDLLQRAGGLGSGAAVGDVQVVRAHVADGAAPEVFQVDLEAILHKKDQETNVRLEPFDQVYIAQSRRSRFCSCVPPWLQPCFDAVCGIHNEVPVRGNPALAGGK